LPEETDVFIAQMADSFPDVKAKAFAWWSHHFSDQKLSRDMVCYARAYEALVVTLSQAHYRDITKAFKLDAVVIGHGCEATAEPVEKVPGSAIYASAPDRGLSKIKEWWGHIEPNISQLTVCGGHGVYGIKGDDSIHQWFAKQPKCRVLGALNREELWQEMAAHQYLIYPSIWQETYCMAADEAASLGCVPLVSHLGALPERFNNVLPMEAATWGDALAGKGLKPALRVPLQSWADVAKQWEGVLIDKLG